MSAHWKNLELLNMSALEWMLQGHEDCTLHEQTKQHIKSHTSNARFEAEQENYF
jgi:hypothetical protein